MYSLSPQIDMVASEKGCVRELAMNHCQVSVSNTSTVDRLLRPSYPPATMREWPLHTAAVQYRLVGIAGRLGSHFMSLPSPMRLRRELVAPPDIRPPTIVSI